MPRKESAKKWRDKNKEHIKAYRAKWVEAHPDYAKQYRESHPGLNTAHVREWIKNHKEKELNRKRKWRADNPGYHKQWEENNPEYSKQYYAQNREAILKHVSQWYKTKDGKACAQRAAYNRRTYMKDSINTLTSDEWLDILKQHGYRCIYCGKHFTKFKLTMEHIIPVSKGGDNVKENIVPACKSCNSKMSNDFELKLKILEDRIKKGGKM